MRLLAPATLILCVATGCVQQPVQKISVERPPRGIAADGVTEVRLAISAARPRVPALDAEVREGGGHGRARMEESPTPALVYRAGVWPGENHVTISGEGMVPVSVAISSTPAYDDSYRDGVPEFFRLHSVTDRRAFRNWFTRIAQQEAFANQPPSEIADCAGLLRFCYREAMRRHDAAWAKEAGVDAGSTSSDLTQYLYPSTPLGSRVFRTRAGKFSPSDLTDGTFAEFADARSLMVANAHLVSRDVRRVRPGDLLFYLQPDQQSPFHSMIFVGGSTFGPGSDWVVYHTGRDGRWRGEIRRVSLASLVSHPDQRWRPTMSNPRFLGVYRWNILREDD